MDTFIVILVLIILFVLLGGAAWFFGKEAGPGAGMAWLTNTRQVRHLFSSSQEAPFSSRQPAVMVDDTRMHELAAELREEITRTLALGEGIETRLRSLETEFGHTRRLPETLNARVQTVQSETDAHLATLRREMTRSRTADSPYGVRRNDAVRDLYQKLAQIDVALGAVVNPMLLPGEPVSVPESLYEDTLVWANWGDVADRAYAFGEAFSKNRVLLDPALAERVEVFISTFRAALTGTVYPIVQESATTPAQQAQLRAGIVTVVEGITPIRREFEQTWLQGTRIGQDDFDA